MIEMKAGVPTDSLLRELQEIRQTLATCANAYSWQDGRDYYLSAVERLDGHFGHSLVDDVWNERLYSGAYWAVRDMSEGMIRPLPLLQAEGGRLVRWLVEIERELKRVAEQDEWDRESIPRFVFDTSALVREGSLDTFDWRTLLKVPSSRARLVFPLLVIRELDDLKDQGKSDKARPRLRKIFKILEGRGRGPAPVSKGVTLELLMDPPGHSRFASHDEEIVRRARYLKGRPGGPLIIVSGDYTMLATAGADGIDAVLTPAELTIVADD
jgi:hypothetical protein